MLRMMVIVRRLSRGSLALATRVGRGWPSTLNPSQRILLPLAVYTVTHFRTTFEPLLDWSFYSGPG